MSKHLLHSGGVKRGITKCCLTTEFQCSASFGPGSSSRTVAGAPSILNADSLYGFSSTAVFDSPDSFSTEVRRAATGLLIRRNVVRVRPQMILEDLCDGSIDHGPAPYRLGRC